MKKRFISLFFALVVICSLVVACGSQVTIEATEEVSSLFNLELVGKAKVDDDTFFYYRDLVTDVIYLRAGRKVMNAGQGGLTVMLDPETGLPLTYARYLEIAEER